MGWSRVIRFSEVSFSKACSPEIFFFQELLLKSNGIFVKDMKPERFAMTCCTAGQSNQEGVDGENLVSETKNFTYRDAQWFNSNIWSYISGKRFTVCNLFKSLNFDELVFLLFSGEIGFQGPCLHIRGGFFLLLPSGFLAENICWILGPQSPTPLGYQHSCYMYIFVLGSLAMRGTLTLIKFPAARTRVNVMIGKWRRWNSHLGQIGKRGDQSWLAAKGSWCDIVLHCIAARF